MAAIWLVIPSIAASCSDDADAAAPIVFAAASLTAAFEEVGAELERTEQITVRFNFGASSDLARSIEDGSPAEVFASADERVMDPLTDAGVVDDIQTFATNRMAIAVARGDPLDIRTLEDLSGDVAVALCAPEVPCGGYARAVLERAGVDVEPRSFEADVKAVLTRVALGEVDAGIVYGSDVVSSDEVSEVPIPDRVNVTARFVIAEVGSPSRAAHAFFEFLLSERGADVLRRHGFGTP